MPPISLRPVHTAVTVPVSSAMEIARAGWPEVGRAVMRVTLPQMHTRSRAACRRSVSTPAARRLRRLGFRACDGVSTSSADQCPPNVVLDASGDQHQYFVTLLQDGVASWHHDVTGAQHGNDGGLARSPRSVSSLAMAGDPAANVTSASRALPPSRLSSRTKDPTVTASSTNAVSRWGVDTEMSTPHISLNIHSFFGLFTRASTRCTPNSCLDSSETTRLSSSSPVTAATTSAWAAPSAFKCGDLACVAEVPGDADRSTRRPTLCDDRAVVVDEGHAVARALQLACHVAPDTSGAGDDDVHQCAPGCVERLVEQAWSSAGTTTCTMSSSWRRLAPAPGCSTRRND